MAVVFRCRNQLTRYMTATGAANSAKRRAKSISSFFMAVSPLQVMVRLPSLGKDFRDSHHLLELFEKKRPPNRVAQSWREVIQSSPTEAARRTAI